MPWTYIIFHLNNEEIVGRSHEKELQKTNQKELRIEKVIKRKGNKLYVKWKGYNNNNLASLNTEVDKMDVDKLKTAPVDLAKLSNVVKMML